MMSRDEINKGFDKLTQKYRKQTYQWAITSLMTFVVGVSVGFVLWYP